MSTYRVLVRKGDRVLFTGTYSNVNLATNERNKWLDHFSETTDCSGFVLGELDYFNEVHKEKKR